MVAQSLAQAKPLPNPGGTLCIQPFLQEDAYSNATITTGNFYASALIADKSLTVSNFVVGVVTAMVGGTLFRLGLYTIDSVDAWTLVARSSGAIGDISTNGLVTVAFNTTGGYPATFTTITGAKYGLGLCQAGATTVPNFIRKTLVVTDPNATPVYAFKRCVFIGGAGDCPTTVAAAQGWGTFMPWIALV